MTPLDGRSLSQKILTQLKAKLDRLPIKPRLDIILVGDDPASLKFTQIKQQRASEIGLSTNLHQIEASTSDSDLISLITILNQDPTVTAILVQLPLPQSLDTSSVINSIAPAKDADGLTALNLGRLFQGSPEALAPAVAAAIARLLAEYAINLSGKNVVIVNNTSLIGLPLLAIFNRLGATVTLCHELTADLPGLTRTADILVTAVGRPRYLTADYIKEGSVVIDAGSALDPQSGKLSGDVNFASVSPKVSFITPCPGGVGPMTVALLLENTVKLFKSS